MAVIMVSEPFFIKGFLNYITGYEITASVIIGGILYALSTFIFMIFSIIWMWKMFKAVGRPGWWALMAPAFPALGLILGLSFMFGMAGLEKSYSILLVMTLIPLIIYFVMLGIAAWGKRK